jgi:sec-independent protein translocase protein TatA
MSPSLIQLLFGASRLSEIGKGLGSGIRNFKKGLEDEPSGPDQKQPSGGSANAERESRA